MKEFTFALKQSFMVNKWNFIKIFSIVAACGAVGILISLWIAYLDASGRFYGQGGAATAVSGGALILLIVGGAETVPLDFNLAASMGRARKSFVLTRYISCLVCVAGSLGIALLIGWLEEILYPLLFPGRLCIFNINGVIGEPIIFLGVSLLTPVLLLFVMAMVLRFANKFILIFFGGGMLLSALGMRIFSVSKREPDSLLGKIGRGIAELFTKSPTVAVALALCMVGVICMVVVVGILRKQRVTF